MAAGEYVSVKAEAELIQRELKIERKSLIENHAMEISELQAIYMQKGLTKSEALIISQAIHRDPEIALEVHAKEELGIDPDNIGDPVAAALSSFVAFSFGAIVTLVPWFFSSGNTATAMSLIAALVAAATIGAGLAVFTERSLPKTIFRQVAVAVVACSITYVVGEQFI